jgi:hypothetical protein
MKRLLAWLCLLFLTGCHPGALPVFAVADDSEDVIMLPVRTADLPRVTETRSVFVSTATPVADTRLLRLVSAIEPLLPGVLTDVFVAGDGALWLASDRGVARILANERRVYLARFWDFVVGPDDEGRIWVIDKGREQISAWDGVEWEHYGVAQGWYWFAVDKGQALAQPGLQRDALGGYWLQTAQDVRRFDGRRWRVYRQDEIGLASPDRRAMHVNLSFALAPDGKSVWVGSCYWLNGKPVGGGGLRWFDGAVWRDGGGSIDHGCLQEIVFDAKGDLWVGIDGNLWQWDGTDWREWSPPALANSALSYGFVRELVADDQGGVWPLFGLCGMAGCDVWGIRYHWIDGDWLPAGGVGMLDSGQLIVDAEGQAWLFGPLAIASLQEGKWKEVANLRIYSLGRDHQGQIWLAARFNDTDAIWNFFVEP